MKFTLRTLAVVLLVATTISGCKLANDEEHLDIGSFRILSNGNVVAEQNGTTVTGNITLNAQATSDVMTLELRDPDGGIITVTDDDLYLEVDTNNPGVVLAQNSSASRWSFTLTGVGPGSAAITIKLMHGSHADFESRPIPVTVN